jgi:GT2 family glycosyltransferase
MPDQCDIIMPVWNQLEVTRECVDSILRNTDFPFRLIVIDNGSDSAVREYLAGLGSANGVACDVIRNERNLGFAAAVNQGIRASGSGYICIMNNDTVAAPGWLGEMISIMRSDPGIGILNPSSNTSGQFPPEGVSVDDYAAGLKSFKGRVEELNTCRGFCMLLKREVVEKIGLFDEIYSVGYFEETDFCKRAVKAGFNLGRAKASYVYHKEGVSFKEIGGKDSIFSENEAIYFKRWGRLVRVAYILESGYSARKVDDIALSVARAGHQILIFTKRKAAWPVSAEHFDIRRVDVGPAFCAVDSFVRILKRRKKKAVGLILTDSAPLGAFLNCTRLLHGADVIVAPEKEGVLKALAARSSDLTGRYGNER